MNKKAREIVRAKFGGNCAFCGCDVSKGMHIWDIEPIQTVVMESGNMETVNNELENLYPACKSCEATRRKSNNNKAKMTIEEFRNDLYQSFSFLRYGGMTATSYGKALRFGLIKETGNPIEFYFEKSESTQDHLAK